MNILLAIHRSTVRPLQLAATVDFCLYIDFMKQCFGCSLGLMVAVLISGCGDSPATKTEEWTKTPIKPLRKAAEKGDAEAQYGLGARYYVGAGVERNPTQAVAWFRRAAEQGYVRGQLGLAVMYSKGEGVLRDPAEALKWCHKAADQGDEGAQIFLGNKYFHGGAGFPTNYVEAFKWYSLAVAQSNGAGIPQRELVKRSLSPAQIAEGERLVREFRPRHTYPYGTNLRTPYN